MKTLNIFLSSMMLCLLAVIMPFASATTISDSAANTASLQDLGILQLAAHDLFNVDRDLEIDFENGKLDLSTLFDHGEENIVLGGEPRNRENIFIFTVASAYGEKYQQLRTRGFTEKQAKKIVITRYNQDVERTYERVFGEAYPRPKRGKVTMTENLALRTIHDFLPGEITFNGEVVPILDQSLHGQKLSRKELQQPSGPLDGEFDPAFLNITIFIPPNTIININLLEEDIGFGEQFNTEHGFETFMAELEDGSYDNRELTMSYIRELFAKGQMPNYGAPTPRPRPWIRG